MMPFPHHFQGSSGGRTAALRWSKAHAFTLSDESRGFPLPKRKELISRTETRHGTEYGSACHRPNVPRRTPDPYRHFPTLCKLKFQHKI